MSRPKRPRPEPTPVTEVTTFRVCVEWLLPPSRRPAGGTVVEAIGGQVPISPWLEVCDWFRLSEWLRTKLPVHTRGLLYGHQKRVSPAGPDPYGYDARLAEIKAHADAGTIRDYFDGQNAARDAMYADVARRVREFVAGFDFTAYGLAAALDMAAEAR